MLATVEVFCRDATHWINKSDWIRSGKPRDVVRLIGCVINGCSFTAGTTWSLSITFIKASTGKASEKLPSPLHMCLFAVEMT